jgi:hypothetical protein
MLMYTRHTFRSLGLSRLVLAALATFFNKLLGELDSLGTA